MHAMLPVNQSIQACDDALHHHIHHRRDGENQSSICLAPWCGCKPRQKEEGTRALHFAFQHHYNTRHESTTHQQRSIRISIFSQEHQQASYQHQQQQQ
jgi:hypothetical protein